jgi:hypothetical protein
MDELNEQNIQELSVEALLEAYLKAAQLLEDTEASLSVIKDEMALRLDAEGVEGKIVSDYTLTKVKRLLFRPTLEQARELAATKTVEQVDTQALKRLHDQGVEIPNTTTTVYVMVKPLEKGGATT